jgi:hypothetical protein
MLAPRAGKRFARTRIRLAAAARSRRGETKQSRHHRWGMRWTGWTTRPLIIQDVVNLERRDELNLRPWYQRRIVWTTPQQSYLINTIHEQKPVPSIYIRHSIDVGTGRSIREVVDGQQRLAAVLEYAADKFAARHPNIPKPVKFTQLTSKERHQFLTTRAVRRLPFGGGRFGRH